MAIAERGSYNNNLWLVYCGLIERRNAGGEMILPAQIIPAEDFKRLTPEQKLLACLGADSTFTGAFSGCPKKGLAEKRIQF